MWEIKKFNCVQNFSIETSDDKHKFNAQALTYIPRPLKLIISGYIYLFDFEAIILKTRNFDLWLRQAL